MCIVLDQDLAADRSVYVLWPLAAGCHSHIYTYLAYLYRQVSNEVKCPDHPLREGEAASTLHLGSLHFKPSAIGIAIYLYCSLPAFARALATW